MSEKRYELAEGLTKEGQEAVRTANEAVEKGINEDYESRFAGAMQGGRLELTVKDNRTGIVNTIKTKSLRDFLDEMHELYEADVD
ncbi:MAG TPA: hypothetical protein PLR18_01350 [bacterium]|nr:hypothetical protein [bacterium]